MLLGNGIAEALKKRAGQQVEIEGTIFRVAGIFQATNPFDSNSIVAPLGAVQKLMERPQVISEIQVRVKDYMRDEAALDQVCRSIEQLCDSQGQLLGLKEQRTQYGRCFPGYPLSCTVAERLLADGDILCSRPQRKGEPSIERSLSHDIFSLHQEADVMLLPPNRRLYCSFVWEPSHAWLVGGGR